MSIHLREDSYIGLLTEREHTVKELSSKLFISEPTVRRDIAVLKKKNLLTCSRGIVRLQANSPDIRIPMFIRDLEQQDKKQIIAQKAAAHIRDGFVIMLDASTTAYCLIPFLTQFKNLFVITSGAKTAVALATMGIHCLCTGGEIASQSFSYVGADAERTLKNYNADIAFISCRGLKDSVATDSSIMEDTVRQIMIQNSRQTYLLCDSSKLEKKYIHTLCHINEIAGVITDEEESL